MLNFKIFAVLLLVIPQILAAGIWYRTKSLESHESLESPETLEVFDRSLEDLHHVKINWQPVWDDIAGENEFVVKAVGKKGKPILVKTPILLTKSIKANKPSTLLTTV